MPKTHTKKELDEPHLGSRFLVRMPPPKCPCHWCPPALLHLAGHSGLWRRHYVLTGYMQEISNIILAFPVTFSLYASSRFPTPGTWRFSSLNPFHFPYSVQCFLWAMTRQAIGQKQWPHHATSTFYLFACTTSKILIWFISVFIAFSRIAAFACYLTVAPSWGRMGAYYELKGGKEPEMSFLPTLHPSHIHPCL